MKSDRGFYRHARTGEVFVVELSWSGEVLGAAGPLAKDELKKPLDDISLTGSLNDFQQPDTLTDFLQRDSDKLIRIGGVDNA